MRRRGGLTGQYPCYDFDEGGTPLYLGNFLNAQPWRTRLYKLISLEQFCAWHAVDWALQLSSPDIAVTANILAATRKRYSDEMGGGEFCVIIHPAYTSTSATDAFIAMLQDRNVSVLDLRPLATSEPEVAHVFCDQHPTPESHRRLAEHLAEYVSNSQS